MLSSRSCRWRVHHSQAVRWAVWLRLRIHTQVWIQPMPVHIQGLISNDRKSMPNMYHNYCGVSVQHKLYVWARWNKISDWIMQCLLGVFSSLHILYTKCPRIVVALFLWKVVKYMVNNEQSHSLIPTFCYVVKLVCMIWDLYHGGYVTHMLHCITLLVQEQ